MPVNKILLGCVKSRLWPKGLAGFVVGGICLSARGPAGFNRERKKKICPRQTGDSSQSCI